jgi:hypothetical protein
VEVEKDVGENAEGAVAGGIVVLDAKDAAKELGFFGVAKPCKFFLALFFEDLFESFGVLFGFIEKADTLLFPVIFGHSGLRERL